MTEAAAEQTVGPEALKGLAHPLRMQLLMALNDRGSATASQLADDLGESSGATSYHLRQLHRHGFIIEDAERGTARERYWRQRRGGWNLPALDLADDPANAAAVDVVLHEQLRADQRRMVEAIANARSWPSEWRAAMARQDAHVTLGAEQTAAMYAELSAVVERYRELEPDPQARRVSVLVAVTPTNHERPA